MSDLFPIKPKIINKISFTVNFKPKPQERGQSAAIPLKKDGNQVFKKGKPVYTSMVHKSTKQAGYEKELMPLLEQHKPDKPMTGAMVMSIIVYLPIPESWSPWKKDAAARRVLLPTASRSGDLSNFFKCIEDCMQKCGYFANDSYICGYYKPYKVYTAHTPRWEIKLWEIWQPQTAKEYREFMGSLQ